MWSWYIGRRCLHIQIDFILCVFIFSAVHFVPRTHCFYEQAWQAPSTGSSICNWQVAFPRLQAPPHCSPGPVSSAKCASRRMRISGIGLSGPLRLVYKNRRIKGSKQVLEGSGLSYVLVCMCVHVCVLDRRQQEHLPQLLSTLVLETKSGWTWNSVIQPDCLASKP